MRRVYLDHNATTPVAPEVLAAMLPYFCEEYGNASSIHAFGQRGRGAVEEARGSVAAMVGAQPGEIMFNSGGTESNNLAIFGIVRAAAGSHPHVITSSVEHNAVLDPFAALEQEGADVTILRVNPDGVFDPDDVRRAIRPETVLISLMLANNELGTVEPIEEIGNVAAERGVPLHIDAVQAAGKIPIDVRKLGARLLSISAHKFHGPKGVGALYVRKGIYLKPLMYGGHNERDRRPGTEDVAGIVGMGKAAELVHDRLELETVRIGALRDCLEQSLLQRIPDGRINGLGTRRTPNTTNLTFSGVDGEAMVIALDLKGIACSTGAACSTGKIEPSHVLIAIGLTPEDARATLRLSLGSQTDDADIDYALEVIPPVIEHLRDLSPTYKKPVAARAT
jgi:cysteine desulfurase